MNQLNLYYRAFKDYRKHTKKDKLCIKQRQRIKEYSNEFDKLETIRTVCKVDEKWVEQIEIGLPFVEKAIAEERQFIKNEGEVLDIEKVKRVSKDSVEHLAKHSDLITHVPKDGGDIIPDKIYMVERLSDYAVYENRFIYMLLCYVRDFIDSRLKKIKELGVEVGITVGGGNFWRGRQGAEMDRVTADYMGMMATVINALALRDAFERQGVPAMVMSSVNISKIAEPFETKRANKLLRDGTVLIFACGTGNPFFTTDTGAALKAIELEADVLLLAKNVDGIYTADPKKDKNAIKYTDIS